MPMREPDFYAAALSALNAGAPGTPPAMREALARNIALRCRAALREGHLEGDAVAGAEDEWQPGMLAVNARHDVPGVFPALGQAAYVQSIEHSHGAIYLKFGSGGSHTYLADLFDRALPAKTGGRHGE